jgi:FkbM family methyltransferase
MDYKKIVVRFAKGNGYELIELGKIENVEIINQAERIFGPPEKLLWESPNCHLEKGDAVLEIGACIGLFSLRAGLQGARRIVSFEPNRENFQCAVHNAKVGFAGRESNVKFYNAAVCDYDGVAPFYDVPAVGQHGLFKYTRKADAREVETMCLDTLWRKKVITKIDFLKCDANGAEYLVFAGISDANLSKIRKLSVQYHHQVTDAAPGWREAFLKRLESLGFKTETGPVNCWKDDWLRAWK